MKSHSLMSFIILVLMSSCADKDQNIIRKRIKNNIVEANFINDTLINGMAKYYDLQGRMISKIEYSNGLKNGLAVGYFKNGIIRDSMYYRYDLPNGPSFLFDSSGKLKISKFDYNGLSVGPHIYYDSGIIKKYRFIDFESNSLAVCEYDVTHKCRLLKYSNQPIISEIVTTKRNNLLKLFFYLPNPPYLKVSSKLGLENGLHQTKNETTINSSGLFLDTLLNYPEPGWHYFISTHIENDDGSINKIYFHELQTESSNP